MDYIPYPVTRRPGRQQAEYKRRPGEIDLPTIPTYAGNGTLGQLGHVMISEHTVSEYILNKWSIYEATSSICC